MTISLQKGATVSLAKAAGPKGLNRIALGVGWDVAKPKGFFARLTAPSDIDLDASAIAFDARGGVIDTVWFQKLASSCGSIRHSGDNLTGEGDGDDETITIDLNRLPGAIETIILTVNSFRGQTFNEVDNAFGRVVDLDTGSEMARFQISDSGPHTGVILASLKRSDGEWQYKAIGAHCGGRTVQQIIDEARGLI